MKTDKKNIRYIFLLNSWSMGLPYPSWLWDFQRKFRSYFWNKSWYKNLILYRFRKFLGKSYLKDGWHSNKK